MGYLEDKNKKDLRKIKVRNFILSTVYTAGLVSAAVLAPNVIGAMAKLNILPKKRQKEIIHNSRNQLIKKGLLVYKNGFLSITSKGELQLKHWSTSAILQKKKKVWDRKWRVLIFDIPETKRTIRLKVRNTLKEIGFLRLQDSVWIYPYDCEEYVNLMKADFRIGKDLLYMIVDHLEYDAYIRKHFRL